MLIELYCYISILDNNFIIEEIIKKVVEKNINILVIINYDILFGLDEVFVFGEYYGIIIILGIEILVYDYKNRKRVYIFGYNIDLNS